MRQSAGAPSRIAGVRRQPTSRIAGWVPPATARRVAGRWERVGHLGWTASTCNCRGGAMGDGVKFAPVGLTFDDVLLLPAHSTVMPSEADLTARLTPRLTLRIRSEERRVRER